MAQEEIEISIDAHGRVQVRTIGIKGNRCLDVAEQFARILGREESRQLTSEYYEAEQTTKTHVDVKQQR
jgi:prophage antirepressor-like protein